MENFGHHSKVKLDSREFHIHTGSLFEKNKIVTEVFEKGKFITSRELDFEARKADTTDTLQSFVKSIARDLHEEMIEEVRTLFMIHEKIQVLKQYIPHFRLGTVFFKKNFLNHAIVNFEEVLNIKPDFAPAYLYLGLCKIKIRDFDEAEEFLKHGIALESGYPDLLNVYGVIQTIFKNYQSAIDYFQKAISINQQYDEVHFNLGIALFRSTLVDLKKDEKAIVPSRVVRFLKKLMHDENYQQESWQLQFENTLKAIEQENLEEVLLQLENLQLNLVTHVDINTLVETFYLRFMYGGKELSTDELEEYEKRIREEEDYRSEFADYWNQIGTIHMIQCRNLFLKSMEEFENAVKINQKYDEASRNLDMIKNNKKGFLILLRAILK